MTNQNYKSHPVGIRHALSLLAILFVCVTSYSQSFFGGLALGGVTSQVDGDHNNGFHKIGFTGGAFVGLRLTDFVETQLEIKYIQKGSRSSADDPYQFTIRLDYVEMPIIAAANLGFLNINGKTINWISLEAGASLDVLAHTNQKNNGANENGQNQWKRMCINGILGIKFNLSQKLQFDIRVITSINSAYAGNFYDRGALRFGQWGAFNDAVAFAFFYRF